MEELADVVTDVSGPNSTGNSTVEEEFEYTLPWYLQAFYITIFVAMVIVASGGNCIVIWVVLSHKRMRTVTNYFLVNLAIADTLISILNTLVTFLYLMYQDWWFGNVYCKFSTFICICTVSASVFTFMAIAIERYVGILYPLRPRTRPRTILVSIAAIWLLACAIAFPNILYNRTKPDGERTHCVPAWPDGHYGTWDLVYNIGIMVLNYALPLGALAAAYVRVGIELWSSRAIGETTTRQEQAIRNKRKVVKMMIVVVVIFAICWFPYHLYFILTNLYPNITRWAYVQHLYLVIYWFAMSNSMYNPFIYCWLNANFRQGFQYVFRCCPCVNYDATIANVGKPRQGPPIPQMSLTDTTKIDRNGFDNAISGQAETSYISNAKSRGGRMVRL